MRKKILVYYVLFRKRIGRALVVFMAFFNLFAMINLITVASWEFTVYFVNLIIAFSYFRFRYYRKKEQEAKPGDVITTALE